MIAIRRFRPWPGLVLLAAFVACGSPPLANEETIVEQPDGSAGAAGLGGSAGAGDPGGGGGASAGSAGAAASDVFACVVGESVFYGAPVDAANACLDTASLVAIGCGLPQQQVGERCLQRRSDGARYWSMLDGVSRYDATLWEPCATSGLGTPEQRPPVCTTRTCAVPAPAFCTPEGIVEKHSCGSPISKWDESCCERPKCVTGADCASDQECRSFSFVSHTCWPQGDANSCECAGVPMVREGLYCGPLPSG